MSKLAVRKANQWILKHKDGDVLYVQDAYIAAYDQAMQDFMEKACKYLSPINYTHPHLIDLDEFKKVLQNE